MPGDVIGIADPIKNAKRHGGRVVSASTSSVVLDSDFAFVNASYSLSVMLPNGNSQTRTVTSGSGTKNTVTVSPPFTAAPQAGSVWVLQENSEGVRKFRVLSATEDNGIVTVVAVLYEESKYELADSGTILGTARIANRQQRVVPVVSGNTIILGAPS